LKVISVKASFLKRTGETREMWFVPLELMPEGILPERKEVNEARKSSDPKLELVWDLEAKGFRMFNWGTLVDRPEILEIEKNKLR
jgi:hypothetical protein